MNKPFFKLLATLPGLCQEPTLQVKKLDPRAILPCYQTAGAACFDLHALLDKDLILCTERSVSISTGLAFEIPDGHVMQVFSRSGHGFKHHVRLVNGTGIIDSDYRGELRIGLTMDRDDSADFRLTIRNGDRIAQALLMPVRQWRMQEVAYLNQTARGNGGYGSTGSAGSFSAA